MLRELTGEDWLRFLGLRPEQVPPVLILRGTRNLKARYAVFSGRCTDVVEVGSPNGLFEDVLIGRLGGIPIGYAAVYGPAMASEITHVFGKMGTGTVFQTGVCGALGDGIGPGDLIVATAAGCGEGGVACYLPGTATVAATEELVRLARDTDIGDVPCHVGPIWTTAALLAEGEEQIEGWHRGGYIAMDMETATTFGVAEWAGMRRVSVLSVFDNPRSGAHIALTDADKAEARRVGDAAVNQVVERLVQQIGG